MKRRRDLPRRSARSRPSCGTRTPDWRERMAAWEETVARRPARRGRSSQPTSTTISTGGQKYLPLDGRLDPGRRATRRRSTPSQFTAQDRAARASRAFRLELLNDPNLPLRRARAGRSRAPCALTEFKVEAAPADEPDKAREVKFVKATADVEPAGTRAGADLRRQAASKRRVTGPVEFAIDGKDETAWGIDAGPGRRNVPRKAVFVAREADRLRRRARCSRSRSKQNHGGWNSDDNQNNNLGRFRLSVTDGRRRRRPTRCPQRVREILAIPRETAHAGPGRRRLQLLADDGARVEGGQRADRGALEAASGGLVAAGARASATSRATTHMLKRGDFLKPRQAGRRPACPAFLHPLPADAPPTRLTSPAGWSTASRRRRRASIVNRVWQAYFGTGLVAHQRGLRHAGRAAVASRAARLAGRRVHGSRLEPEAPAPADRHSATYRQSSQVDAGAAARAIPYNRLLARGPRFRVEAEIVRDIALAASGLLESDGRRPERLSAGAGVPVPAAGQLRPEDLDRGRPAPDRYRRALYTFRYRSVPYPMLQTFDAPNGDFACVRRTRSNTPLQALTTLNEPLFIECARALALQDADAKAAATDAERLALRLPPLPVAASRPPTSRAVLLDAAATSRRSGSPTAGLNPWELAAGEPEQPPAAARTARRPPSWPPGRPSPACC